MISARFQSTRPPARTRHHFIIKIFFFYVSIHASSREDATYTSHNQTSKSLFQSTHTPARTRHGQGRINTKLSGFNPRVLAGGRDETIIITPAATRFQSTRTRGRTRQCNKQTCNTCGVSIHASSREDATLRKPFYIMCGSFNPRVLAGGRDRCISFYFK